MVTPRHVNSDLNRACVWLIPGPVSEYSEPRKTQQSRKGFLCTLTLLRLIPNPGELQAAGPERRPERRDPQPESVRGQEPVLLPDQGPVPGRRDRQRLQGRGQCAARLPHLRLDLRFTRASPLPLVSQLVDALKEQEEINLRLRQYMDKIILAILDHNPSILEIKQ